MRNKHIPAESDNAIKSERSLENEGGQQEVITDITDIEELEKDSGLEKSQIQNWLKRKRVEHSKKETKENGENKSNFKAKRVKHEE